MRADVWALFLLHERAEGKVEDTAAAREKKKKKRAANLEGKQASNIYSHLSGAATYSDKTTRVGRL